MRLEKMSQEQLEQFVGEELAELGEGIYTTKDGMVTVKEVRYLQIVGIRDPREPRWSPLRHKEVVPEPNWEPGEYIDHPTEYVVHSADQAAKICKQTRTVWDARVLWERKRNDSSKSESQRQRRLRRISGE